MKEENNINLLSSAEKFMGACFNEIPFMTDAKIQTLYKRKNTKMAVDFVKKDNGAFIIDVGQAEIALRWLGKIMQPTNLRIVRKRARKKTILHYKGLSSHAIKTSEAKTLEKMFMLMECGFVVRSPLKDDEISINRKAKNVLDVLKDMQNTKA